jgi:hypothetical protein
MGRQVSQLAPALSLICGVAGELSATSSGGIKVVHQEVMTAYITSHAI